MEDEHICRVYKDVRGMETGMARIPATMKPMPRGVSMGSDDRTGRPLLLNFGFLYDPLLDFR